MADPDVPLVGVIKHWLVGNIPGNDISKGLTLAFYLSPTPIPGTGLHRYTFLVYRQPSLLKFDENIVTASTTGQGDTSDVALVCPEPS
ncbi:Uncharacterized protein OBRU01_02550 [Operophtera brumata]|uniref:Phosphatidylethanolamine-binding protein n=1 Tax=Operophtera brumata TaxID=104452 RepID=A0A0L7LF74_OPEBR|nr:Uncharacterized protein OBRU01_02550 [Operophtera brumata]